jgi:hypothetical protein
MANPDVQTNWRHVDSEQIARRFTRYMSDYRARRINQGQLMSALDVLAIDAENLLGYDDSGQPIESA